MKLHFALNFRVTFLYFHARGLLFAKVIFVFFFFFYKDFKWNIGGALRLLAPPILHFHVCWAAGLSERAFCSETLLFFQSEAKALGVREARARANRAREARQASGELQASPYIFWLKN